MALNLPPPITQRSLDITEQQRQQRARAYDEHSPWSELSGLCVEDAMQPDSNDAPQSSKADLAETSDGEDSPVTQHVRDFVKDGQALADAARIRAQQWSDTVTSARKTSVSLPASSRSDAEEKGVEPVLDAGGMESGRVQITGGGGYVVETPWDGITQVTVAELDWRDDVAFLQPPFDVVLVADVVRATGNFE